MSDLTDNIANYLYDSVPERDFVFARTPAGSGANTSQPRIGLIPAKERKRSQDEIANDLQRKLLRFNDARIFATQDQTISVGGRRGGLPVQFILQNQDLNKLRDIIPRFLEEAKKDKTFSNVDVKEIIISRFLYSQRIKILTFCFIFYRQALEQILITKGLFEKPFENY